MKNSKLLKVLAMITLCIGFFNTIAFADDVESTPEEIVAPSTTEVPSDTSEVGSPSTTLPSSEDGTLSDDSSLED